MPRNLLLSKLLSQYHPIPSQRFYQKMDNAPWNQTKQTTAYRSIRPFRFAWQMALVVFLAIIALSLSIPTVRASISAWLGLSIAPSSHMPAQSVTLEAITPSLPSSTVPAAVPPVTVATPIETAISTQALATSSNPASPEINQLSKKIGWGVLTPAHLLGNYRFQSAYFDTNHQMAILTFTSTQTLPGAADPSLTATKTITLLEAQANNFVPMQVAPDATVEDVLVNGQPAVYAMGAWDTEFVKDDKDPNGGKMVSTWWSDIPLKNIYWQLGKVYLVIMADDDNISQNDLLQMAESIH